MDPDCECTCKWCADDEHCHDPLSECWVTLCTDECPEDCFTDHEGAL